jgi:hypothetical protein
LDNTANLLWGVLFGAIGFAYFLYGRKQSKTVLFLCGIGLMVFPYFIANTAVLIAMSGILIVVPYLMR